jgi:hypothetical protein
MTAEAMSRASVGAGVGSFLAAGASGAIRLGALESEPLRPRLATEDVSSDSLSLVKLDKLLASFESTRVKRSPLAVGDVTDKISKQAFEFARTVASASDNVTRRASPMASM